MSKVRVILKPAGFIIAAFVAMIGTIIVVFLVATQPERFQKLLEGTGKATAAPAPPPTPASPASPAASESPSATAAVPATAQTLDKWLVLAPIPSATVPAADEQAQSTAMVEMLEKVGVPGEGQLNPRAKETVSVGGKTLVWEADTATLLNIAAHKKAGASYDNAVGYAVTYVDQPEAVQDATLYVGSDDGVAVWLNGKEIWRNPVLRSCVAGSDKIAHLPLKQGRNVLVFKVGQGGNDWCVTAALEAN